LNHTEFINKLEELSQVVQGAPVSKWDLFSSQATVIITIIFASLMLGFLAATPVIAMHLAVKDEIKDSGNSSNVPIWFLSMSIALVFSVLIGIMTGGLGQEFISNVVSHDKELQQQYNVRQQSLTDLYNQLVDTSDDDFEKLETAKSSYKLTKEQEVKYNDVMRTINEVAVSKKKLHE
jgi:hypothetical protein